MVSTNARPNFQSICVEASSRRHRYSLTILSVVQVNLIAAELDSDLFAASFHVAMHWVSESGSWRWHLKQDFRQVTCKSWNCKKFLISSTSAQRLHTKHLGSERHKRQ